MAYPRKPLLRVELSALRRGRKRCSGRRFPSLKSLDSGNLLKRPNRSIQALGHLRPWRQIPDRVLEGRRYCLSEREKTESLRALALKKNTVWTVRGREGAHIYRQPMVHQLEPSALMTARLSKPNGRLTRGASLWEASKTLVSNPSAVLALKGINA